MNLRTLYLKRGWSVSGRHSLAGRQLYDQFRSISSDCLLGVIVLPDQEAANYSHPNLVPIRVTDDVIPVSRVKSLDPNLIYLERGLFADANFEKGQWRLPQTFAEELVANGAVMIIADVDYNLLLPRSHKAFYRKASHFLGASVDYGEEEKDSPIYGIDRITGDRSFVSKPERMRVSEWLRPIYSNISEILVENPIRLTGSWYDPLASGDRASTGILQGDVWVEERDSCVFASVANFGFGYTVFITGDVSHDDILTRCPDNVKWLTNIGKFLLEEAARERIRTLSHLKSPHVLFLSHRSVDNVLVMQIAAQIKQRGIAIWLDKEKLIPSDSLIDEINCGLEQMTHFVLFWSEACVHSGWVKKELSAATAKLIGNQLPIFVVRLDNAPVPAILSDRYSIEGSSMSSSEIGNAIVDAVERLVKRNGA